MVAVLIGPRLRSTLNVVNKYSVNTWRPIGRPTLSVTGAGGSAAQGRHHSTASSVSTSEVSHFSRLASSWWDPHGPSRLLHLMNPLRHDFIQSCINSSALTTPQSFSFLDIGCGGGIFASSAARLPTTSAVTAIDPTELVIKVAKSHQRSDPAILPPRLRYLNCAIEDLPVPSVEEDQVDILTLFEVLEHIDSPSSFLELAIPHVKPGGWIIGSTIARSPVAYLTTKLIAEAPLIGVVPAGTHDWNKYINPSELRQYFESRAPGTWGDFQTQGVTYVPALGWQSVDKSEDFGNYFFGIQKLD
ncbi:3-demethylubiquinone-9 3-O-methyltransferase [Rhinocladiella mackenziei CBS 650.93]|uniref:Ubiquinone biosynthesis O-methyltransferase, mitochondrial n=1 Tax=Rhinocladiella mackenziei CBS 650.93 TaxID=1442369 RepID=A0A0D2FHZ8_9EURO|nr:3-demethylubiquinone-9 3-O-methyltransferase [Rhinocladiella mackenziei CBS 650.93]KIX01607.1 3-demethylubiquinone-9 3-O-methyltransferase [Rhinocladiella mackenziei CBS 650.93]